MPESRFKCGLKRGQARHLQGRLQTAIRTEPVMERDRDRLQEPPATAGEFVRAPKSEAAPAGLRRSTDGERGLARRRTASGFDYLNARGQRVRDARVLDRIASLAIPPAWTDVWICADPCGHLQATGRDARGRKQYRYHPLWREQRESEKFASIAGFAQALPRVRAAVARDLALPGLPRRKVIAAIVRLLDRTLARIGGSEYARDNATYGLTTLCKRHLRLRGRSLVLSFKGKHGVKHELEIDDAPVRRVVLACRRLPGADLFVCREDDRLHRIAAEDVNHYLREAGGCAITAKDFRIWGASVAALALLGKLDAPRSRRAAQMGSAAAIREVAALLRNTPAVCRRSYVHPCVVEAWHADSLCALPLRRGKAALAPAERAFAALLASLS